jgi:hypothetical protein
MYIELDNINIIIICVLTLILLIFLYTTNKKEYYTNTEFDSTIMKITDAETKLAELEKKLISQTVNGGFAIDGEGTTMLLFEGEHKLTDNAKYDAWTNNTWDMIFLYKGWKFSAWDNQNKEGKTIEVINKSEDVKKIHLNHTDPKIGNEISYYELKWIGF